VLFALVSRPTFAPSTAHLLSYQWLLSVQIAAINTVHPVIKPTSPKASVCTHHHS